MASSSKRSRLPAIALGAAALFCLCGVGGTGVVLSVVSGRAKGLPSAFERARAAGLAVTVRDLRREADPALDARGDVERADAFLRGLPKGAVEELFELGNTLLSFEATPEQRARLVSAMRRAEPAMAAFRSAAAHPQFSVDQPEVRFDPRGQTPGEVLGLGAMLFACEALLRGEAHDLPKARQALERGRALLGHLEAEETYLAFRRRAWAEIRLQRALVRTVQANADRPEAVALLRDFQAKLGPLPSVRKAVAGDLALALDAIARRKGDEMEQLPLADPFKDMGRADVAGIFTRAVGRLPEDPEDLDAIDRAFARMEDEASDAPIYGGYAKGYRGIQFSLTDVITRRRLAVAALAVLEAVGRGKVPNALPELGKNGIDPHNGKPFRFRRDERRIVIYSVGRDTLDDGGRETPPRRLGVQTRDVVFAIPLRPNGMRS